MHTFLFLAAQSQKKSKLACSLRDMKEGCFLFVWCPYRDTSKTKYQEVVFWTLQQQVWGRRWEEGSLFKIILLFDTCPKKKKNFHYFITFYTRLLSNVETVRWHRSSVRFIHCFLHNRIKQVCVVLLSVLTNLRSPLTRTVEQENVAACTLCNCVIRHRFTPFVWERGEQTVLDVLTVLVFLSTLTAESKLAATQAGLPARMHAWMCECM